MKVVFAAACLSGAMILSACGQTEISTGSSAQYPKGVSSETPLGASQVSGDNKEGPENKEPGKIVPPVKELPIDELAPTYSPTPAPTASEVISAEDVYQVLSNYGLFYASDTDYINTAAALTRDGGYADWVNVVRKEAQKQYPAAADEIAQGRTMKEIMIPWVAIYANKKGISPNIVDWEQTDILRYIVALDVWPTIEEFNTMIDTSDF